MWESGGGGVGVAVGRGVGVGVGAGVEVGPGVAVGGGTGVTVGRAVGDGFVVSCAVVTVSATRPSSSPELHPDRAKTAIMAITARAPILEMGRNDELFT